MLGHLGHRGAQAARVLLGDHQRQIQDACGADEHAAALGHAVEVEHRLAEGLLDVDHHQRRAAAVQHAGGHQLTAPMAKLRSRKATAPAATVIRTRPISVRPWKAQLAERLS